MTAIDILERDDPVFPQSLPEFQQLFPDDGACAAYLERARWPDGFVCPHCRQTVEPFRIVVDPAFWSAVPVVANPASSSARSWGAVILLSASVLGRVPGRQPDAGNVGGELQRQLGLTRYGTAFGILHKLRAGMVRPDKDRIGGRAKEYVEVDQAWVGGKTRGEGRGAHHKTLVAAAVEVRRRKPGTAQDKRKDGRYAGRVRLAIAVDRSADSLWALSKKPSRQGR